MMFRVVRKSRNTGRVLKVLHTEESHLRCELWMEGFGKHRETKDTFLMIEAI